MEIRDSRIDSGKAFDWGRVSEDYARYRDIYPKEFYQRIADKGLCINGQTVLDLGTGTGVLPRNMYPYGAQWTGTDISPEQIRQAELLSEGMNIRYLAVSSENLDFPPESFDVITACQCFWYFDHEKVIPKLASFLRPEGKLLILFMAWLPYEDKIAERSEALVRRFNPEWSGAGETMHPIKIPDVTYAYFDMAEHEEYRLKVPFTRETWHGRMKACRGVGASLPEDRLYEWDCRHKELLLKTAPEKFEVQHYAASALLQKKGS